MALSHHIPRWNIRLTGFTLHELNLFSPSICMYKSISCNVMLYFFFARCTKRRTTFGIHFIATSCSCAKLIQMLVRVVIAHTCVRRGDSVKAKRPGDTEKSNKDQTFCLEIIWEDKKSTRHIFGHVDEKGDGPLCDSWRWIVWDLDRCKLIKDKKRSSSWFPLPFIPIWCLMVRVSVSVQSRPFRKLHKWNGRTIFGIWHSRKTRPSFNLWLSFQSIDDSHLR